MRACVSSPARLGAPRRRRRERIVRPGMARVAPAHLGAHRRIGAAPEARQIARDLHRLVAGRQQLEHQRNAPARDASDAARGRTAPAGGSRWSGRLRPRSRSRHACRSAPRNASALRCRGGGAAARGAVRSARRGDRPARAADTAVFPANSGDEPVDVRGERRIGEIRPFVAFGSAQEHHAVAPLGQRLGPRQLARCRRAQCLRRARARSRRSARPCGSAR